MIYSLPFLSLSRLKHNHDWHHDNQELEVELVLLEDSILTLDQMILVSEMMQLMKILLPDFDSRGNFKETEHPLLPNRLKLWKKNSKELITLMSSPEKDWPRKLICQRQGFKSGFLIEEPNGGEKRSWGIKGSQEFRQEGHQHLLRQHHLIIIIIIHREEQVLQTTQPPVTATTDIIITLLLIITTTIVVPRVKVLLFLMPTTTQVIITALCHLRLQQLQLQLQLLLQGLVSIWILMDSQMDSTLQFLIRWDLLLTHTGKCIAVLSSLYIRIKCLAINISLRFSLKFDI